MSHAVEPLSVPPLPAELRKSTLLGTKVTLPTSMGHIDISALSESDKETLCSGLFENGVVVIRNQQGLDPNVVPQLGRFFDAAAWDIHSGGEKMVTDEKNILSVNRGARVPRAQQVSVIGKGRFLGHEGIEELDLKQVSHTKFHETPLSAEEIGQGFTRPYRWHMDAPLYERLPGFVTSLHALRVPDGEIVDIPAGATTFYSGARAFQIRREEEEGFALNTLVRYAPRVYGWMLDCKATDDALTIAKVGKEKKLHELPEWSWDKMVWKNAHNGEPHLQVLGACLYELHTTDLITGELNGPSSDDDPEARLLWQCTMASSTAPVSYRQ
ncbi:hypothetical protein K504DRAFT_477543 [Pleomassaria siparia CBS 279.74]|uniref:TauD/TfdA-like domain-containing protein n=1 Tax=Pleomassaria siparia CBS 279.74 TaxID=1314801 RepID=A0A6G1K5A3_9PLEO|nr:hypothetical protein K504DRAFT_477543 [Pleomassaria siparia CBS 279.74]